MCIFYTVCFCIPAYHWETILNYANSDPISDGDNGGQRKQRKTIRERAELAAKKNKMTKGESKISSPQRDIASDSAIGKTMLVNFKSRNTYKVIAYEYFRHRLGTHGGIFHLNCC